MTDDIFFGTEIAPTGAPVGAVPTPVPGFVEEEVVAMGGIFGVIAGVALTVVSLMYVGKYREREIRMRAETLRKQLGNDLYG